MSSNAHMMCCQAAFNITCCVQGLAYSVSGGWNTTPADHVGLFVAGGETAKPVEFLAALQRLLQVCSGPMVSTCHQHMSMPHDKPNASAAMDDAATSWAAIRLSMAEGLVQYSVHIHGNLLHFAELNGMYRGGA